MWSIVENLLLASAVQRCSKDWAVVSRAIRNHIDRYGTDEDNFRQSEYYSAQKCRKFFDILMRDLGSKTRSRGVRTADRRLDLIVDYLREKRKVELRARVEQVCSNLDAIVRDLVAVKSGRADAQIRDRYAPHVDVPVPELAVVMQQRAIKLRNKQAAKERRKREKERLVQDDVEEEEEEEEQEEQEEQDVEQEEEQPVQDDDCEEQEQVVKEKEEKTVSSPPTTTDVDAPSSRKRARERNVDDQDEDESEAKRKRQVRNDEKEQEEEKSSSSSSSLASSNRRAVRSSASLPNVSRKAETTNRRSSMGLVSGDQKAQMRRIWRALSKHRDSPIFRRPVRAAEAPDYDEMVLARMDLSTMKSKIDHAEKTGYAMAAFYRDFMLMIQNAMMYNAPGSDVCDMAVSLKRFGKKQFVPLLAEE
jgi:Bromodomain